MNPHTKAAVLGTAAAGGSIAAMITMLATPGQPTYEAIILTFLISTWPMVAAVLLWAWRHAQVAAESAQQRHDDLYAHLPGAVRSAVHEGVRDYHERAVE